MRGYGEPAGSSPAAVAHDGGTLTTTRTWFGWGWGDPDPDTLHTAAASGLTWAGTETDWSYGDPATLESDHILWMSSQRMPDEGGEIVELQAEWTETGPWRIRLIQAFTGAVFGYANSPQPGDGIDCYTDTIEVEELGSLVTKPGARLRFVLPPLPTGAYDVQIESASPALLGSALLLENAVEVVYRSRALQTYAYRRRFPKPYSLGVRELSVEPLLGVHPNADADEGAP